MILLKVTYPKSSVSIGASFSISCSNANKKQDLPDVGERKIYNYDDQFERPAHEGKEKMPVLMWSGIYMVQ